MRKQFSILLPVLCIFICACHIKPGYSSYKALPSDGWDKTEWVDFEIDTISQTGTYQLVACLATQAAKPYAYQTLTLEVKEQWDSLEAQSKTITVRLADREGRGYKPGVSTYRFEYPLWKRELTRESKGRISIRHKMRSAVVEGISHVGLKIKPLQR